MPVERSWVESAGVIARLFDFGTIGRLLFASAHPKATSAALKPALLHLASLAAILFAGLFVNKLILDFLPNIWMALILLLAFGMARMTYASTDAAAIRLWKLLGALSAFYGLLHFPLFPFLETISAQLLYASVVAVWVVALLCGIACFRIPSLALIPPAYLVWSKSITHDITGLRHRHILDVAPLPEVSICLALGLLLVALYYRWIAARPNRSPPAEDGGIAVGVEFGRIVLIAAICIHLANYFWSFVAKITLDGPFLSWIRYNNPLNIYLAASDDGHVTFSDYALASDVIGNFIDSTHIASNIFVFVAQLVAVFGFVMSKRALIVLLICFDGMHIGIAIAAGANFWPWIFLNLAIAAVVARRDFPHPKPLLGVIAGGFICLSPIVANVALLGWFDSGANNNAQMYVQMRDGKRIKVTPNFYTFYSYPMSHMRYGMPDPDTAFWVGHPNGGTRDFWVLEAAQRCDADALIIPGRVPQMPQPSFDNFVRNYHEMALSVRSNIGMFPYDYYPHHFFVMPNREFATLDLNDVSAYIYRRESVCLSFEDGKVERRVVTVGEHRIDL